MLDKTEHVDVNDAPMALIKISTENITSEERRKFIFKGNLATFFDVQFEPSEIYLYITAEAANFIEIHHPDYGKTEYWLPETLKPYCGYEMVVQYVPLVNEQEEIKPQNTYLIVSTDQDDAVIYIDGEYVGIKEASKSLAIGTTHEWRIECDLYHSECGSLIVNEKTEINKSLRPAYGFVNVTSQPENGALVFVNNKKVGETPYQSDKLSSGSYTVKVMKDMFHVTEKTIEVVDGQTTNAVLNMTANFVNVTINTDSQSDIYVDEEYKGKGQWMGRLSDGIHFAEVKKASHETSIRNIDLVLGNDVTFTIEAPKPIYGFLDINSDPMKADIYIDGKHYGQTPSVINNILVGKHELMLEKEGYSYFAKNITIVKEETLFLEETLKAGKEIKIITDMEGDSIYVDSYYVGVSPVTMTISYDTHNFKAIRISDVLEQTVSINEDSGFVRLMFNEINGHKYVDLGLPSGLKWATCNIGANKPEEYGDYFAWGEISTKTKYGYGSNYTKNNMKDISGCVQYDAATANWGGNWRMPTKDEFQELIDNCIWKWREQNGINGYEIIGLNCNSIFLPSAGKWYGNEYGFTMEGYDGYYWSSIMNKDSYGGFVSSLSFSEYSYRISNYMDGYDGLPIRPVCSYTGYMDGNIINNEDLLSNDKSNSLCENDNFMSTEKHYETIEYKKHSLGIHGGMAMGFHYDYSSVSYGSDVIEYDKWLPVVKSIGLEYGMLNKGEQEIFVNMMCYLPKNKRPAVSFILGASKDGFRLGAGLCYAEYYVPASYSVEYALVKSGLSIGCLVGLNRYFDNNGLFTMDCGMFLLGSHMMFDLRLGIGLMWNKK